MIKERKPSTPAQVRAQKRNSIKWRLMGTVAAFHTQWNSDLYTPEEKKLLGIAREAIEAVIKNFRASSTRLGFKPAKYPKKITVYYEGDPDGRCYARFRHFHASAAGETFEKMKYNMALAMNKYFEKQGVERTVTIEDLNFKPESQP